MILIKMSTADDKMLFSETAIYSIAHDSEKSGTWDRPQDLHGHNAFKIFLIIKFLLRIKELGETDQQTL